MAPKIRPPKQAQDSALSDRQRIHLGLLLVALGATTIGAATLARPLGPAMILDKFLLIGGVSFGAGFGLIAIAPLSARLWSTQIVSPRQAIGSAIIGVVLTGVVASAVAWFFRLGIH